MVVDGFDPDPCRSHRLDEPVSPPVVRAPLVVIAAYRLLDIAAIESALRKPQKCVVRPDERLDRHSISHRSLTTPRAPTDRTLRARCLNRGARISMSRKGSPATIASNRPQRGVTGQSLDPPAIARNPSYLGPIGTPGRPRRSPPEREVVSSNLAGRARGSRTRLRLTVTALRTQGRLGLDGVRNQARDDAGRGKAS